MNASYQTASLPVLNASGQLGDQQRTYAIDGSRLSVSAFKMGHIAAVGESVGELSQSLLTKTAETLSLHMAPKYPYYAH